MSSRFQISGIISCGLIVAVAAPSVSEERHEGAVEIFHCQFDESQWDVNFDAWPDRWVRHAGREYPHYVGIEVLAAEGASQGRALVMELDGGSAAVSSPPILIVPRFMYKLEARVKTENLEQSSVVIKLRFLDENNKELEVHRSQRVQRTDGWMKVNLGPVSLKSHLAQRAVVDCEVVSQGRGDLRGKVWLDDIWLARLPRMNVLTNNPTNVYTKTDDVTVKCELSGIRERDPEIRFQLLDAMSRPLNGEYGDSFRLDGRIIKELIAEDSRRASDIVDGFGAKQVGYEGSTEWQPPIPGYGFYRVAVRMLSSDPASGTSDEEREMYRREIWLAIVPPLPASKKGEFGWSLPHADSPLSFDKLVDLLPNVGINRVKLPVWYDARTPDQGDEIIQFAELLSASDIEVVGVVDRPPAGTELAERFHGLESISDLFSLDPSLWHPSLDPVMTRLALRLRWWQLGSDFDYSLSSLADPTRKVSDIRSQLFRFGQEVQLGIGWMFENAERPTDSVPWGFEVLSATPPLDATALTDHLSRPHADSAQRWILVEPPARTDLSSVPLDEATRRRVRAFLESIIVAKQYGAEAILVPRPFHDEHGVMRNDGTPGELLLPWRTASAMLSAATYMGSLQLPGGSENRLFLRDDGQVVMVVWNDTKTEEILYLGEDIRHLDCWGRTTIPDRDEHRHVISVGRLPAYVIGLHEPITRWRMGFKFDQDGVRSIFRVAHENGVQFQNTFPQGVGGSLAIAIGESLDEAESTSLDEELQLMLRSRWEIDPPKATFSLAAAEEFHLPIKLTLKGANYGRHPARIDFEVDGDQQYKFSVFRKMNVGVGDIAIDVKTHIDDDGQLVVEQLMANRGEGFVDFNCYLYAQGFRRQRSQVYRLGPDEDRKVYRYPDGESLIGTGLLLEAVEIDGPRVLKYQCQAEE